MAKPKDFIIYIEKGTNKTRAMLAWLDKDEHYLETDGHKVIGYVSSGSMDEAIKYGDQVLR